MAQQAESLARRAKRLGDFRYLSDGEAVTILDLATSKSLAEPVEWTVSRSRSGIPSEVRTVVRVYNSVSEYLTLQGRIALDLPHSSHWLLIWGSKRNQEDPVVLRRLDLRDTHRNPDGEWWDRATHKHLWSAADGNDWAYTPADIPHDPAADPDTPDDYRRIYEAFAAECGVDLGPDYKWSDPPLDLSREVQTIWEVP